MLKVNKKTVEKLVGHLEKTNKTIVYDTCMFIEFPNVFQQTKNKLALSSGVYEDLHRYALQQNLEAPRAFRYIEEHKEEIELLNSRTIARGVALRDHIIADVSEAEMRDDLLFISKDADIAAILHKKHGIDVLVILLSDSYSALKAIAYNLPTLDLREYCEENDLEWKIVQGDFFADKGDFIFRLHVEPSNKARTFSLQARRINESAFQELGYYFSESNEQFQKEATKCLKTLRYLS
jgi:hypothetical protein